MKTDNGQYSVAYAIKDSDAPNTITLADLMRLNDMAALHTILSEATTEGTSLPPLQVEEGDYPAGSQVWAFNLNGNNFVRIQFYKANVHAEGVGEIVVELRAKIGPKKEPTVREEVFAAIDKERTYQDTQWGTEFDDKNTANDWSKYVLDYVSKAGPMPKRHPNLILQSVFEENMKKAAAICIAAIETSRRNGGPAKRHYD